MNDREELLTTKDIVKSFPGVTAVDHANFRCSIGEIHGLVGENGAGKSTLMGVLAGIYIPDQGEIYYRGELTEIRDYQEAMELGIALVHQETTLFSELTVCENLFLENPISGGGKLNWNLMEGRSKEILNRVSLDVGVWDKAKTLSVAERQKLEIAKALLKDPQVLILDEPTAPLPRPEVQNLFELLRGLKNEGKTIILISHQVDEILEIASLVTVMKDGSVVDILKTSVVDRDQVVSLMVGRELGDMFPDRQDYVSSGETRKTVLKVTDISMPTWESKVDIEVKEGEILGIGGLQGQGQEELIRALFGLESNSQGTVEVGPLETFPKHPKQAKQGGLALIPSDRQQQGLVLIRSVLENLALPTLENRESCGFIDQEKEHLEIEEVKESLTITASSLAQEVRFLSGGNQQKVVIGKWFIASPKVLMMVEPTRGVDVATKQEIYSLLNHLAESGISVIFTTSDILELVGLCDRVKVMYEGNFSGELSGSELTENNIIQSAIPKQQLSNNE